MGLFDKVLGSGSSDALTPAEGMTGIALAAVAADGVITPEEVQGLVTSLGRMKLFRELGPRQVNACFEKVSKVARAQGVEQMLKQSAQAVPKELRPTAFAIAADLLFADGDVDASERKYLENIQGNLGVPNDLAVKIVEVLAIKNKA